ncbi:ribosome recycling factor [Candidatus Wolfebacteria bacterium]|nr:ribosome recycling factor [Candidatus Wolfebacteria bacterium]
MTDVLKDLELKSGEAIRYFKDQLSGIRGGRPTAKLVEDISVEYFGRKMAVKQLGAISVVPPKEIQISVWDKEVLPIIAKAIELSLNVGVNTEGNLLRIFLPPLSEERRQELVKLVRREAEETKIKIRGSRDEAMKKIKTQEEEKLIGEDEKFRLKDEIQKITDKANAETEKILENKIKEISE